MSETIIVNIQPTFCETLRPKVAILILVTPYICRSKNCIENSKETM